MRTQTHRHTLTTHTHTTHVRTHARTHFVSQLPSGVLHRLLHVRVRNEPITAGLNAGATENGFGESHKQTVRLLLVVLD